MKIRTELICIGTELLEGKINTHAGYIGDRLSSIGLGLSFETTVGDSIQDIKTAFETALERSDVIIATGGLGPTFDDLTRNALADFLKKDLIMNKEVLAGITERFAKRGYKMPKENEVQARVIEGAKVLANNNGTAPGQKMELVYKKHKKQIFLLPGPPREMQPMFEAAVFPELKKHEKGFKKKFILHVCGLSESAVDEMIRPVIESEKKLDKGSVSFTILAHQALVDIHASVKGEDEMLIDETLKNLKKEFYDILGGNIYGEDKETLESAAGNLLAKASKTLSIAESCTGGLLSQKITGIPGSSFYFKEAVVSYTNESKIRLLGVNEQTLKLYGAVSAQTAVEMAEGIRNASNSDYAVSITGVAGPGGGTKEKPVGLVYIGLCGQNIKQAFEFKFFGGRMDIRQAAANQALDMLRKQVSRDTGVKK